MDARIAYHLLSSREAYDESVFHKYEEGAFGQADDRVYEFATYRIATPGCPTQHKAAVCTECASRR